MRPKIKVIILIRNEPKPSNFKFTKMLVKLNKKTQLIILKYKTFMSWKLESFIILVNKKKALRKYTKKKKITSRLLYIKIYNLKNRTGIRNENY